MNWSELKKLRNTEIIEYINNQLEEKSMRKIGQELGVKDDSTIRKFLSGRGYKRVYNKYIDKNGSFDDTCNLSEHTQKNEGITQVTNIPEFKENIVYLSNETETLKDIIEWFKSRYYTSNTSVIEIAKNINIDLPPGNIKRTTIRINETIWDQFNKFVDENKPIDKHDLMGMALKEYMENHSM